MATGRKSTIAILNTSPFISSEKKIRDLNNGQNALKIKAFVSTH